MEKSNFVVDAKHGLSYSYSIDYGGKPESIPLTKISCPDGVEKLRLKHQESKNYLADKIKFK